MCRDGLVLAPAEEGRVRPAEAGHPTSGAASAYPRPEEPGAPDLSAGSQPFPPADSHEPPQSTQLSRPNRNGEVKAPRPRNRKSNATKHFCREHNEVCGHHRGELLESTAAVGGGAAALRCPLIPLRGQGQAHE